MFWKPFDNLWKRELSLYPEPIRITSYNVCYTKLLRKVVSIQLTDQMQDSGMPKQHIVSKSFESADALKSEAEHFIENVKKRSRPIVSGHEGRQALDVALKVIVV